MIISWLWQPTNYTNIIHLSWFVKSWKKKDKKSPKTIEIKHFLLLLQSFILNALKILHSGVATARCLRVGDSFNRIRALYGRSAVSFDLPYASLSYRLSGNDTTGIVIRIDSSALTYIYMARFFQ